MRNDEIVCLINQYKRTNQKDNGISTVRKIVYDLFGTHKDEIESINRFLLEEVVTNLYGFWSISLQIIIFSKQANIAPILENYFRLYSNDKDDNWKEAVIMAMFKLEYGKPLDIYYEYLNNRIQTKSKTRDDFFIIVNYLKVDPENGIDFLSDYYAERLLSTSSFVYNDSWRLGYLISYLIVGHSESLIEIVKQTNKKNKVAGNYLKTLMINYLKSKPRDDVSMDKVHDLVLNLETLV